MWKDVANRGPETRRILGLCGGHTYGIRMALEVAALVVTLATMADTGLLLHDVSAVPLWVTPWLPVLFVLSSLSCGLAVVLGVSQLMGSASAFGVVCARLAGVDVAVVALEAIAAGCVIFSARSGAGFGGQTALAAQDSVARLLSGDLAELFWGGFVVVGLVVPAVVEMLLVSRRRIRSGRRAGASGVALNRGGQRRVFGVFGISGVAGISGSPGVLGISGASAAPSLSLATLPSGSTPSVYPTNSAMLSLLASACVLVGGFALRACVLGAGMHPVLSTMGVM